MKFRARQLKSNLIILNLSYSDPRVKWYAKLFTLCVVAYTFSPIDLIPDFIPILGYLDDLIIVPLGIFLALKMLPKDVIEENRAGNKKQAQELVYGNIVHRCLGASCHLGFYVYLYEILLIQ